MDRDRDQTEGTLARTLRLVLVAVCLAAALAGAVRFAHDVAPASPSEAALSSPAPAAPPRRPWALAALAVLFAAAPALWARRQVANRRPDDGRR